MTYPKFKRGVRGYALMLRVLMDRPQTTKELEATLGMGNAPLRLLMSQMRSRKLVHVCEWVRNESGRAWYMRWAVGDHPDASRPLNRLGQQSPAPRPAKSRARPELVAFSIMLDCLREGASITTISEQTGTYRDTVSQHIKFMQSLKLLHVAGWDRGEGINPFPLYMWGNAPNVPRPKAKTKKEYDSQAWERKKQRNATVRMLKAISGQLPRRVGNAGSFKPKETHDRTYANPEVL